MPIDLVAPLWMGEVHPRRHPRSAFTCALSQQVAGGFGTHWNMSSIPLPLSAYTQKAFMHTHTYTQRGTDRQSECEWGRERDRHLRAPSLSHFMVSDLQTKRMLNFAHLHPIPLGVITNQPCTCIEYHAAPCAPVRPPVPSLRRLYAN